MYFPKSKASLFSFWALLLFWGTALSGCVTLSARKAKKSCIEGDCTLLHMKKEGPISLEPDDLDRETNDYNFKLLDPQGTPEGIRIQVESQKLCQGLHYTQDLYTLPKPNIPHGTPWIGGGALLFIPSMVPAVANIPALRWSLAGGGGAAIGFGLYELIYGYSFRYIADRAEKGEFYPCDEYAKLPEEGGVNATFPSMDSNRARKPLKPILDQFIVPIDVLGFAHLKDPMSPLAQIEPSLDESNKEYPLNAPTPAVREWLCETMRYIDSIDATGDPVDWKVLFKFSEEPPLAALPWQYEDGIAMLRYHKNTLRRCNQEIRQKLMDVSNEAVKRNEKAYKDIKLAVYGIVPQPLYVPKSMRTGMLDPLAQSSNGTAPPPATKESSSSKRKRRKSGRRSSGSSSKGLDSYGFGKPPYGRYRCTTSGQIANLTIRKDGGFILMVELDSGSAYGVCDDKVCRIQGVKGSALAFTEGFQAFKIQPSRTSLLLNGKIRCDLR
jgi:hypothetical protein